MWESIWNFFYFHPEITVVGAITLIQIAPIKIDPWSSIARGIRKLLIGTIETKIDRITEKVTTLEERVKEDKALQARTQILRFADELYDKDSRYHYHSKEHFEDMLDKIDFYEKYCLANPDFKNNKTVMSADRIKQTYRRLMEEHKF